MSIEACTWAMDAGGLTPAAKLVLILVADVADMDGRKFEPFDWIAEKANISSDHFEGCVLELTNAGLMAWSVADGRSRSQVRCLQLFVGA